MVAKCKAVQDYRKYAVAPPDSQPEDPEDPAWFESPLKHYVPSWVLHPQCEDNGGVAACETDWDKSQVNHAETWTHTPDQTEWAEWTNWGSHETAYSDGNYADTYSTAVDTKKIDWTDWAWGEDQAKTDETAENFGGENAESYNSNGHHADTYKAADNYGEDTAWAAWDTAESFGDGTPWTSGHNETGEHLGGETAETYPDGPNKTTEGYVDHTAWDWGDQDQANFKETAESFGAETHETTESFGDGTPWTPGDGEAKPVETGEHLGGETAETYPESFGAETHETTESFGDGTPWTSGDGEAKPVETGEHLGGETAETYPDGSNKTTEGYVDHTALDWGDQDQANFKETAESFGAETHETTESFGDGTPWTSGDGEAKPTETAENLVGEEIHTTASDESQAKTNRDCRKQQWGDWQAGRLG